ncbi:MAG: D-hexose-6-phosphate mutarotase [Kiritimatiellales bacterium]|nr:D-hexose-6-phosphate mutarotase [Kiritimatiellales bacterium]
MKSAAELQAQFGIDGVVSISDRTPNYPVIEINNAHAKASIALHGGHVMTFQPHGQDPVLWVSDTAYYQEGKSIRGGIPVCWPWFGKHPSNPDLPAHGFVRYHFWELDAVEHDQNNATCVKLSIRDDEETRKKWPHAFELELTVVVAADLSVSLKMTNRCPEPKTFTSAMHTYLQVGDISEIEIAGLENTDYLDHLNANKLESQQGRIRFDGEVDRIYKDTAADIVVHDPKLNRKIRTQKTGSHTAVVWNPWIAKSATMADFDVGGYRRMVCVETTNAVTDEVLLDAGASHCLGTIILVEQ